MAFERVATAKIFLYGLALLSVVLFVGGCGEEVELQYKPPASDESVIRPAGIPTLSETALEGRDLFNNNCGSCHGENASGTSQGPPLVHIYYEPGHHSDASFRNAVQNGVPAHHWSFGDMPPVSGVSPDEVDKIICYVRETQRDSDIFEGDDFLTAC